MNREWTDEEIEILRRDRAAKVPVPVTAAKLGRPVPATYLRARRIGSLVQPHQSWDDATVARLRQLVLADPPMTDKQIAAELGRTVTQVRWKMKDLDLIGVRDLSKLAKITSSKPSTHVIARKPAPAQQQPRSAGPVQAVQTPRQKPSPKPDVKIVTSSAELCTPLELALKLLEGRMAAHLRTLIAESEAGLIEAAKAAIAQKARIDLRLAKLSARPVKLKAAKLTAKQVRQASPAAVPSAPRAASIPAQMSDTPHHKASTASAAPPAPPLKEDIRSPARREERTAHLAPRMPAARQERLPQPPSPPVQPAAPKIVVVDTVAPPPPEAPEPSTAPTSGRGGWKAVRRDPARVVAQARAKATNRADAVDLAQAAQAAIEKFIAERGVTRSTNESSQVLVSRLQARGYIVVRDENGWLVDQRHRLASEADLASFAEARGITLDVAA